MYAIIETGGKQIKVAVEDKVFIEKIDVEAGKEVTFDKVVLVGGTSTKAGTPYVEGATVTAVVEKHGKGEKVIVFKYRAKHNIHKKTGHRQPYTLVSIKAINA